MALGKPAGEGGGDTALPHKGDGICKIMNWSDKAKEIAENIYDEKHRPNPSSSKEHLIEMLEEAAIKGMEFELKNWLDRPRNNNN